MNKRDKFGRVWKLPKNELCPKCGQPDSCGDCNHKRLPNKQAQHLMFALSIKKLVNKLAMLPEPTPTN